MLVIAKNYLSADEVDTLNRLVVIFLEQAELRTKERKELTSDNITTVFVDSLCNSIFSMTAATSCCVMML